MMDAESDDLLRFLHGYLLEKFRKADKVWHSLLYFFSVDREDAIRRLKLSKEEYKEVLDCIDRSSTFTEFNAGDYLLRNEKKFTRISTGFAELDSILDLREKGIIPGHIYEICGPPDSGKSAFCHSLAARIALVSKKNVLFIDTKGDFHGSAVMEFLVRHAPDIVTDEVEQEIMLSASSRIRVATATLPSKVIELLDDIYRKIKGLPDACDEQTYFKSLGCIFLDNIANITSYEQAEEDNERGGETLMIGSILHRLADKFLIHIFIVNRNTDIDAELHLSLTRNFNTEATATEAMDTEDDLVKAEDVLEKKLYFTEAGRTWEPLVHHRMDFRADRENRLTVVTLKKSAYRPCGSTCRIKILT